MEDTARPDQTVQVDAAIPLASAGCLDAARPIERDRGKDMGGGWREVVARPDQSGIPTGHGGAGTLLVVL